MDENSAGAGNDRERDNRALAGDVSKIARAFDNRKARQVMDAMFDKAREIGASAMDVLAACTFVVAGAEGMAERISAAADGPETQKGPRAAS